MSDAITNLVDNAVGSPWVYIALFAFAMIDGFFPVVPSESLVVSAGVFAASGGEPWLPGVILAAAAGAFAGDHFSYGIGATAGRKVLSGGDKQSRRARALARGGRLLDERGGVILLMSRYIPGARTAITLTSGAVAYPLRRFSSFDAAAALSWGAYSALIGYAGGAAFEDDPLKGLFLGLGIALGITVLIELVRHLRNRPAPATT
jgi:membrane protein DedA with SNARE-associated domain